MTLGMEIHAKVYLCQNNI